VTQARRTFTYQEALQSFPRVRELTQEAVAQVEALYRGTRAVEEGEQDPEADQEIGEAVREIVARWADQVTALGCEVKGVWLVDWDSGDGYYCWRYPEEALSYFHGYEEGFAGRIPIQ
jgi:hypothetical protein